MGMKANTGLSLIAPEQEKELPSVIRELRRLDTQVSIDFAANAAKESYDTKHRPISFEVGEEVYLKLHKGYNLPGKPNPKLSEQRTGPFKIVKKIGRLAYELDLPPSWKVHRVISVAHLQPAPKGKDLFSRPKPNIQEPVEGVEGDTDE
jgi:hypothetical protein